VLYNSLKTVNDSNFANRPAASSFASSSVNNGFAPAEVASENPLESGFPNFPPGSPPPVLFAAEDAKEASEEEEEEEEESSSLVDEIAAVRVRIARPEPSRASTPTHPRALRAFNHPSSSPRVVHRTRRALNVSTAVALTRRR
jgi:hypothetical protein